MLFISTGFGITPSWLYIVRRVSRTALSRAVIILLIVCGISGCPPAWSQHTVIKPGDLWKFDEYTLSEWMMSAGRWAFTSYDNVVIRPAPDNVTMNHKSPKVFINGVPVQTAWLHHPMMHLVGFSKNYIDSLVFHPPGSFAYQVHNPAGAIAIYLDETHLLQISADVSNPVDDPGPILYHKLSPNVERVKKNADVFFNYSTGNYRSQLLANISTYSYSNVLYYDREPYRYKLNRVPRESGQIWWYQTPLSIVQAHQLKTSESIYAAVLSLSWHLNNFLWDDWAGKEISSRYHMYNAGVSRTPRSGMGWSAALSYSFAGTTPISESYFYIYDIDQHGIFANLNYSMRLRNQDILTLGLVRDHMIYDSRSQGEVLEAADHYATVSYQRAQFRGDVSAGTDKGGIQLVYYDVGLPGSFVRAAYNRDGSDRLSQVHPRLETGFGLMNTNEHASWQIEEPLRQEYFVQSIGLSAHRSLLLSGRPTSRGNGIPVTGSSETHRPLPADRSSRTVQFGFDWSLSHMYFTSYPYRETRFESPDPDEIQYPLNAHFIYRNLRNSGNLYASGALQASWLNWRLGSRIAMTLYAWGDPEFVENNRRFAGINFSQQLRYHMHETFQIKGSYSYISARSFKEFITEPGDPPLWPPPDVRPVHKASLGFYQSLFRERLIAKLVLRNLFNNKETWHPNGLFFNFSMILGVQLQY